MTSLRFIHRALLSSCLLLAACATTPSAKSVALLGPHALIGSWKSELDDSVLTVERAGAFRIERANAPTATGRWSLEGSAVVFVSDAPASLTDCANIEGAYLPEVVRDTVRFTKLRDDCPAREESMAWPWRRRL